MNVLGQVMDALDIETFLVCDDEEQGRTLTLDLMKKLGFQDVDIVFLQHEGTGVRIRARGYIHRSGDQYGWLKVEREDK